MKFTGAFSNKCRRVWSIVLIIFVFQLVFHNWDASIVLRGVQRSPPHYEKTIWRKSSQNRLNESQLPVADETTAKIIPRSIAIIVVTDMAASKASWIASRMVHFKCYAAAHHYDFIHHVIDMAMYPHVSFYTARWKAIFESYWEKYEWIFAHDTDSLYPDFSINLSRFTESSSAHVQVLARGTEIGANALLFRARNSTFSEAFMRRLIALGYRIPRPSSRTNYDVHDVMMVVLELMHPELATICESIDDFFEFAKCFTPVIERIPQIPSVAVPMKIHLPMSGFVQQFEAPSSEYGLLFGACWPGHVLLSGNGVKERAPYPRDYGHACARDSTMDGPCTWLSHDEQVNAASKCCLLEAIICDQKTSTCVSNISASDGHTIRDNLTCRVGWPVLWAGGGEILDAAVPQCTAPYITLKRPGIHWDSSTYFQSFKARVTAR